MLKDILLAGVYQSSDIPSCLFHESVHTLMLPYSVTQHGQSLDLGVQLTQPEHTCPNTNFDLRQEISP